jgi:hypothetical protein
VQLLGVLASPFFTRAREQVAGSVALAGAAILEHVQMFARDPAQMPKFRAPFDLHQNDGQNTSS